MSTIMKANKEFIDARTSLSALYNGVTTSAEYAKEFRMLEAAHKKQCRRLHKQEREDREPTEREKEVADLDLKTKTYSKLLKFDNSNDAKAALRLAFDDSEWTTRGPPPSRGRAARTSTCRTAEQDPTTASTASW